MKKVILLLFITIFLPCYIVSRPQQDYINRLIETAAKGYKNLDETDLFFKCATTANKNDLIDSALEDLLKKKTVNSEEEKAAKIISEYKEYNNSSFQVKVASKVYPLVSTLFTLFNIIGIKNNINASVAYDYGNLPAERMEQINYIYQARMPAKIVDPYIVLTDLGSAPAQYLNYIGLKKALKSNFGSIETTSFESNKEILNAIKKGKKRGNERLHAHYQAQNNLFGIIRTLSEIGFTFSTSDTRVQYVPVVTCIANLFGYYFFSKKSKAQE